MHRLPSDTSSLSMERPALSPGAAAHLRVLRPRDGEPFELFDGRGSSRVYLYSRADGSLSAADAAVRTVPPPPELVLFACVTKSARWDWTVEKATELGATRIVPVVSERTVVRVGPGEGAAKRARWERVALEAARQSDALWLPEIADPVPFAETLPMLDGCDCFVGALSDPPAPPILSALAARRRPWLPPAAYVGPEGDFTPEELAMLAERATCVSFGPSILRAETAAVFALGVLSASLHAMRGADDIKGGATE